MSENPNPPNPPLYADFATIAASLRQAADAFESLADYPAPRQPYVSIDIQPGADDDDEATIAVVDALGEALLGRSGSQRTGGSTHHYGARGNLPGISISVYDKIASPEERKLRDEIAELRRRRDELAAAVAGSEPTEPTGSPAPDGEIPEQLPIPE